MKSRWVYYFGFITLIVSSHCAADDFPIEQWNAWRQHTTDRCPQPTWLQYATAEEAGWSSEKLQLAGYTLLLKGLKDADDTLSIKVPYYLAAAVRKKILSPYLRFTTFTSGDAPDEGYCKMSIDGIDGIDRERRARKDALSVHDYLKNVLPSFKDSYIAGSSSHVMDREGRRISGEYTLTEEDVLNAKKFHDGVVKNSWPIEIWDKNKGTIYKYIKHGDYYEIPFRCLKVKGIANLFCAGRCISVSSGALGSIRVMGACIALGEQAGRGAASMVKEGIG